MVEFQQKQRFRNKIRNANADTMPAINTRHTWTNYSFH